MRFMSTSCGTVVNWMPRNTYDDKSPDLGVKTWCRHARQATSHYLKRCRASLCHILLYRYHFVYVPSQWEMTLQCNISHWLGAFTKWSLIMYLLRAVTLYCIASQIRIISCLLHVTTRHEIFFNFPDFLTFGVRKEILTSEQIMQSLYMLNENIVKKIPLISFRIFLKKPTLMPEQLVA